MGEVRKNSTMAEPSSGRPASSGNLIGRARAPRPPPRRQSTQNTDCEPSPNTSPTPPPPAVFGPPPVPAVFGPPPVPDSQQPKPPRNANPRGRGIGRGAGPPRQPPRQQPQQNFVMSLEPTIESSLYYPVVETVTRENRIITRAIMNATDTADADFLAHALVNIFAVRKTIFEFLMLVIIDETHSTEKSGTLFRGNCLASKVLSSYSLLIARGFLKTLLGPPIQQLIDNPKTYEINPSKIAPGENIETNLENCKWAIRLFLDTILNSINNCPMVIRGICYQLRRIVAEKFPESIYTVIGGFYFLRFVCPAIVSPEGFGVFDKIPDQTRRPLIIVSKVIQNLGNNVEFGKKEAYMIPLNDLILEYLPVVKNLYDELVIVDNDKIEHPIVNIDEALLAKFYKHIYRLQDKIIKSISFLEMTCSVPNNSENALFTHLLEHLGPPESLENDGEDLKRSKNKKKKDKR